jgi:hypothetical protein
VFQPGQTHTMKIKHHPLFSHAITAPAPFQTSRATPGAGPAAK